jgi:hypothetical protein
VMQSLCRLDAQGESYTGTCLPELKGRSSGFVWHQGTDRAYRAFVENQSKTLQVAVDKGNKNIANGAERP